MTQSVSCLFKHEMEEAIKKKKHKKNLPAVNALRQKRSL